MTSTTSFRFPSPFLAAACFATALLPASASLVHAADTTITLKPKEQRNWDLPPNVDRIAIANPDIADIVSIRNKREALLVGKQPGTTTLLVWQQGASGAQRVQVEVRSTLMEGAGNVHLGTQEGNATISGDTDSLLQHEQATKAANASGSKSVGDISTIGSGGMVQVEVKIVEFDKTTLKQLGLSFNNANGGFSYGFASPGTGSNTGSGGSDGSSGSGSALASAFNLVASSLTHNWDANLKLLSSNGMARVLAEPTPAVLSGQSANFLAGGELPILEPQGLGTTTVEYKPFGIGLTVSPTVLSPDRIALKVAPEASDLDYSNAITLNGVQVPAITTRKADTTVELGDGETFVIGGLVSSSLSSTVNKIPLLGDLPIIGAFFRDLNYKRQDKELVIVVTPHLVHALARGTEITLPGDAETKPKLPVWGSWLLHPVGPDPLPGFSK